MNRRGTATEDGTLAIGARLARIRRQRGLTQKDLADRLGVSQPNVSDYERGELRLHGELIIQLATILRVSADEILGLEANQDSVPPKDPQLARRVRDIERLPKRERRELMRNIDAHLRGLRSKGREPK